MATTTAIFFVEFNNITLFFCKIKMTNSSLLPLDLCCFSFSLEFCLWNVLFCEDPVPPGQDGGHQHRPH